MHVAQYAKPVGTCVHVLRAVYILQTVLKAVHYGLSMPQLHCRVVSRGKAFQAAQANSDVGETRCLVQMEPKRPYAADAVTMPIGETSQQSGNAKHFCLRN